ncbi:sulfurtransferase [Chitinasiproducens palmae]|uniref:Thiosulfate/3-mercaptopyruvate sulfurtransferase n=1 Tax=Chitinasiproducens palmae TaxID=1770053 RepID=A0A1H2PQ12_9BURK|nr:sulfurtransferase [Chitinasiproducens palmae]SDV48864.1 thiosulfate/3-mercaptopyruvate sulfurtransferase [Chitinasiproducens palmae]
MTDADHLALRTQHLVDARALAQELDTADAPTLFDVRFVLDGPAGRPAYLDAHLPGARYVDLPTDLAGEASPGVGRRPLPDLAALQTTLRRLGLRWLSQPIVVYDDRQGLSAARAWWLLRWAGFTDVRLLDGGLRAWRDAGLPLVGGDVTAAQGDVVLRGDALQQIDADAAADIARQGVLIDARGSTAYTGETKQADEPRAGHIPGAISLPTAGNLRADGTFLDARALRARFGVAGVSAERPIGVYCGGGVTAAHEILALASIGIPAALYVGSWSAWSHDQARAIATGDQPG